MICLVSDLNKPLIQKCFFVTNFYCFVVPIVVSPAVPDCCPCLLSSKATAKGTVTIE